MLSEGGLGFRVEEVAALAVPGQVRRLSRCLLLKQHNRYKSVMKDGAVVMVKPL